LNYNFASSLKIKNIEYIITDNIGIQFM